MSVGSDSEAQKMTAILTGASGLIKDLDRIQKKITDPHYKFYKSILNFKNSFTDKIDFIIRSGKKKLSEYSYQKELERREAEKKAREELERKQAEMDKFADNAGIDRIELTGVIVETSSGPIRSESGSASTQIKWDFEVVDLEAVPRQYLRYEVNKMAINEAIRAGIREIQGLRIFETSRISIRSN